MQQNAAAGIKDNISSNIYQGRTLTNVSRKQKL